MNFFVASNTSRKTGLTLAVVTETWYPDINGVAHSIRCIIMGLLDLGVTIQLHYIDHKDAQPDARIKYFPKKGFRLPFYHEIQIGFPAKRQLLKEWKESPPDIVQVITEGALGYSAVQAANKLNIPVISDYHTNFQQYTRSYGLGWLEPVVFSYLRRLHNHTAVTLVPTIQLKRELEDLGFKSVDILKRGINTEQFHPKHRSQALRQEWGLSKDDLAVIYVGRLAAEKNLSLAIEAFRKIQTVRQDSKFILVGDGPIRKNIEGENPDFIFSGMQTGASLGKHYASGDLFLSPSITETFGNIVLEAMASGLAVVSFDYAAAADYISHNDNGCKAVYDNNSAFIIEAKQLA